MYLVLLPTKMAIDQDMKELDVSFTALMILGKEKWC